MSSEQQVCCSTVEKIIFILLISLVPSLHSTSHAHFSEFRHQLPLIPILEDSSESPKTWQIRFQGSGSTHLTLDLKIGFLMGSERKVGDEEYSRPGQVIAGGLTTALFDLSRIKDFFGQHTTVNFDLRIGETFGDEERSLKATANFWSDWNVSVIIGPQETCVYEGRLASALNIPMISYFCSDELTSDKRSFPTFSRTRPPDAAITKAVASLVLTYGWNESLTVIHSDSPDDQRSKRVAKSLSLLLGHKGVQAQPAIPYKGPYHHGFGENPFDTIVAQTKATTRIYIIVGEYFEHLGLLLTLKKHKLLDNGEYLVIGVSMDDYKDDTWNPQRYFKGLLEDEIEVEAPSAFGSYLGVLASPPRNFADFSRRVNHWMQEQPFRFQNPLSKLGGLTKIRIEAAYLYDAVKLYTQAVREILDEFSSLEGESPTNQRRSEILSKIVDGRGISRRLRNIRYQSATGHETKMDENGDAEGNFTLIALKNRSGGIGLYPVGLFSRSSSQLPELALYDSIDWVGGEPPLSEPPCGFFGEKCQRDTISLFTIGMLVTASIIVLGGSYLVFRHWRLSRDMEGLLWRIDKKDVEWDTSGLCPWGGAKASGGSTASLARFSTLYAPLVQYRQRLFAAKTTPLTHLDNHMKHQLKLLREIRHENLNAFIGGCLLEESLLLIWDYCSRGSLRDVLDNGDLKLDDMFVSSLVGDLLRGLSYLHDSSPLRYHGNLKPTNCLIDSRWTLKLSDFGLRRYALPHRITPTSSTPGHGHSTGARTSYTHSSLHHHPSSSSSYPLLITSPYLPPEYPLHPKTQARGGTEAYRKGDIYSLGVILWELLRRQSLSAFLGIKEEAEVRSVVTRGYFSESLMAAEDYTCDANEEPFWPSALGLLTSDSYVQSSEGNKGSGNGGSTGLGPQLGTIREVLGDCLKWEPDARPDIKAVRHRLRPLHKGMRSNIFDIMIGLMEKYANSLEILVDERTKQLSEEKRKTESLLYELIPASVAEELKERGRVPAESYESVSIYFSDIVGFTSMSAQSTPLQVVDFLNELYTCFDSIIESFDVYKVETIGDAYMVASGVPVMREGTYHAIELARMALKLLQAVTNFTVRHRPNETVELRIGIHSGPVCAGVVGLKRPRYCLFGDTVNTASRMESTGLPLKIHCSEAFAQLLEKSDFILEERGWLDVKGKGDMHTFWLAGQRLPISSIPNSYSHQLDSD